MTELTQAPIECPYGHLECGIRYIPSYSDFQLIRCRRCTNAYEVCRALSGHGYLRAQTVCTWCRGVCDQDIDSPSGGRDIHTVCRKCRGVSHVLPY